MRVLFYEVTRGDQLLPSNDRNIQAVYWSCLESDERMCVLQTAGRRARNGSRASKRDSDNLATALAPARGRFSANGPVRAGR